MIHFSLLLLIFLDCLICLLACPVPQIYLVRLRHLCMCDSHYEMCDEQSQSSSANPIFGNVSDKIRASKEQNTSVALKTLY